MTNKNMSEVDIDDIMQRIREEVARKSAKAQPPVQDTKYAGQTNFSRGQPVVANNDSRKGREQFVIADFLDYHDKEFLSRAYLGILHRYPDPQGIQTYLPQLRKGELSKTDILGRLRYSKEGRAKSIRVQGLFLRHIISTSFRIPIIGYILQIVFSVTRLPQLQKNVRENYIDSYLRFVQQEEKLARKAEYYQLMGQLSAKADATAIDEIKVRLSAKADATAIDEIKVRLSAKVDADTQTMMEIKSILSNKAELEKVQSVETEISSIIARIKDHKLTIIDQQRRLSLLLEEVRKRLPATISSQQMENIIKEEDHILDAMYIAFEDQFRGTREDIKGRLKIYLPYIRKVNANIDNASFLDVGSGRGEWLELLTENNFQAKGVDLNRVMVRQCVEMGLDVAEHDGIDYLRKQKANSVGVITGFHIIEHLPLHKMIALFDESLRVLKPGGMIIFETPNPENVIVGACNFYIDPTHRRPLNPDSVKFIAEQRGFINIEILRLHKMREITSTGQEVLDDVLHRLFMEQDYSIIGYKG